MPLPHRLIASGVLGGGPTWVTPTDIPAAEAAALKSLYDLTAGAGWTNNTNWGKTTTASNWFGLTVAGGKVTVLSLNTNNLTGDLGGWNPAAFSALATLSIYRNYTMTGNLSSACVFPASIVYFNVQETLLSGVPNVSAARAMTTFSFKDCSLPQATVDAQLYALHAMSLTRTSANGTINIGGTGGTANAAPSGVYQAAAACPVDGSTPGKEIAHELVNDGCGAIANHWATVTFTA